MLPIRMIRNTVPIEFEYEQRVPTMTGSQVIKHRGPVPASLETALVNLVLRVEELEKENERLKEDVRKLTKGKEQK